MAGKKIEKKAVLVYFFPSEIKQLKKIARVQELLRLSPYLRKHTIKSLGIKIDPSEEED